MSEVAKFSDAVTAVGGSASEPADTDLQLSKVRQILYGVQFREFDQRLTDLALRLTTETEQLRSLIGTRLDELERSVLNELKAVNRGVQEFSTQFQADLNERLRRVTVKVDSQTSDVNRLIEERFLELAYRIHGLDAQFHALADHEEPADQDYSHTILSRILGDRVARPDVEATLGHGKRPS
jgi:predicted secreted protein